MEYKFHRALSSSIYVSRLMAQGRSVVSDDQKIRASGLYADWAPGAYSLGDYYNTYAAGALGPEWNQTWECIQAYDSAVYPDIVPGNEAWFTFNKPLHGTAPETARPFLKPQHGTTDTYKPGECMVWTDGLVYQCRRETDFSPEEYPNDWEKTEA